MAADLLVRREFPRPDPGLLARFADAPTGHVCDAQGPQARALDFALRPITPDARFVGTALTVMAGPRDNLAPWAALRVARPGDVLVIATGGYDGCSVVGDVLVGMAKNAGVVAVVTDGLVRDSAGIAATGLAVFARGLSPRAPLKNGPGEIGRRITLGTVTIDAGDLLIGDRDGIVVVPLAEAPAVADALAAVRAKEAKMDAEVAAGRGLPSWMEALLATKEIRTLD